MFAHVKERTIVAGHTHLAMDHWAANRHLLNPGSVGVPLQGRPDASYMIMHGNEAGWTARIRKVPFDLERVLHAFQVQGFVEECGPIGQLVVDEFATSRLQVVPFLLWRQAECPHAVLDHDLVKRFRSVDATPYTSEAYITD
jgi:diadenosine tetraphosphatase ApaH/serine/threonine PP2A family protein phosphatase